MTRAVAGVRRKPIKAADAPSSPARFWLPLGQGFSDARRQPCHDDRVGVGPVGTNRIRLDDFGRKGGSLFLTLPFVTRKQHPFADDSAPQVMFGSHLDLLQSWFPEVS
jgi:hypothetical protein